MQPVVDRLIAEHGTEVKVVYRHFLVPSHGQAQQPAEAAEAAGEQGKFWPMVHALFINQVQLGPALYERLASQLGLDVTAFSASMEKHANIGRIQADVEEGGQRGISRTPTFILNGKPLPGVPGNYETLENVVKEALDAR